MSEKQLLESASVFLVASVENAAEFYRDILGFSFDRYWGEPLLKPYGVRECAVHDLDGYQLAFGQDME